MFFLFLCIVLGWAEPIVQRVARASRNTAYWLAKQVHQILLKREIRVIKNPARTLEVKRPAKLGKQGSAANRGREAAAQHDSVCLKVGGRNVFQPASSLWRQTSLCKFFFTFWPNVTAVSKWLLPFFCNTSRVFGCLLEERAFVDVDCESLGGKGGPLGAVDGAGSQCCLWDSKSCRRPQPQKSGACGEGWEQWPVLSQTRSGFLLCDWRPRPKAEGWMRQERHQDDSHGNC